MYDIKTLSERLNISKESIYKKLNFSMKAELKNHAFKKEGKTYIDDMGESLILQSLRREKQEALSTVLEEEEQDLTDDCNGNCNYNEPDFAITNELQNTEYIEFLKQQINEKDNQIGMLMEFRNNQMSEKDKEIDRLLDINMNLITTLQNEQKIQVTKLLTEKAAEETAAASKPEKKKGFFGWLLGK